MRTKWEPSMPAAAGSSGASSSASLGSDDERGGRTPPSAPHVQTQALAAAQRSSASRRRGKATLQTDMAAQAIVVTAQAIVFLAQWRKSEADVWTRVQPGLVFAALATGLLFIMRWPRFYWRNRWALPPAACAAASTPCAAVPFEGAPAVWRDGTALAAVAWSRLAAAGGGKP